MIKLHFITRFLLLSVSLLPSCSSITPFLTIWRDTPKINPKSTSLSFLCEIVCNCAQISYQIIDIILLHPKLSGSMYFVCSLFVWEKLCIYVFSLLACVRGAGSGLLYRVAGTERDFSLLICLHSQEATVSEINQPLCAGQLTVCFSFGHAGQAWIFLWMKHPGFHLWKDQISTTPGTLSCFIGHLSLSCRTFFHWFFCPLVRELLKRPSSLQEYTIALIDKIHVRSKHICC